MFWFILLGSMSISSNVANSQGNGLAQKRLQGDAVQAALANAVEENARVAKTSSDAIDVINAASCAGSDVQAAVDLAQDGDTVTVPAGSCTWSDSIAIHN